MLKSYIRIAWRNLLKRKVFATINILGLALGFGSSVLIYLFLNYHLSFDKFHNDSDRIYRFVTDTQRDDMEYDASVPPAFGQVFREEYDYSEKVAKAVVQGELVMDVTQTNGSVEKFEEDILFVENEFFEIFNFPLRNGSNAIALSEPNTAVLTENMAQKLFGRSDVVGESFVLENDKSITITGVLQNLPSTTFLENEIFVSFQNLEDFFQFAAGQFWGGITSNLTCYTRLRPNQDIAGIESALTELPKKHRPNSKSRHTYKLQPLAEMHFDSRYGGISTVLLWIFALIGLFLIGIACINFINISTAQSFYRSKEIGIRKVLGSFKKHLFWQFLAETFVISLFAISLGIVFALTFLPSLNDLFGLELSATGLLEPKFILFLGAALLLVAFLSGSYPGILLSRIVPVLALKGKLNHNDTGGSGVRKVLVITQFTLSIILIIATIVISRQIDYALTTDLGFDKDAIVMTDIPMDIEPLQLDALKERLVQINGVVSASGCISSPGGSENNWGTSVKYHNRPEREEFSIQAKLGDEHYIETFGLTLVAGRNFFKADSVMEVVVNEKLAEKLGLASSQELLGKKLDVNTGGMQANIVGVVKDFHHYGFQNKIEPIVIANNINSFGEIGIKLNTSDIKTVITQIDAEWSKTFSNYLFDYRFLDERVAEEYEAEQRYLTLAKVFSALAIFIACLGLYGLILFFVGLRIKEIGIRKVLGSSVTQIMSLFSKDFLKLILIAGLIASPIAWYIMDRWLETYTYRIDISWWVFVLAVLSVIVITLITVSYQTIKAAIANPIKSLRTE
ncbi:MAG: ABC transporter permease [Bacteroidota bacterium]